MKTVDLLYNNTIFSLRLKELKISAGLAGVEGSIGLEVGSFGLGTAVAGSIALIADGSIRVGTGVSLFSRKAQNNYHHHNVKEQYEYKKPKSHISEKKGSKDAPRRQL